jgi:HD-like signal output (HDOD) protein
MSETRARLVTTLVEQLVDKPDFPAFSQQIEEALRALDDEEVSAQRLAELVLRNYSLTLKVLRTANSFSFNRAGVPIFSVTQAIFRLGVARVRALVGSLMFFEHFEARTGPVKELVLLSLVSASHAANAATKTGYAQPEEAYLCGMLRNLGEVLLACYFPDDYARIVSQAAQSQATSAEACVRELGFGFEDLGREMVTRWGLPPGVAASMVDDLPDPREAPRLSVLAALGHRLTGALYRGDARDARARLALIVQKLGGPLGLSSQAVSEIVEAAAADARRTLARLNVKPKELQILDRSKVALRTSGEAPARVESGPATLQASEGSRPPDGAGEPLLPASQDDLFRRLTSEVDDVLETRAGSDLHAVLLMVLEAVQRGAGFDRVLFGLVTPDKKAVHGRVAIGSGSEPLKDLFAFPLSVQGGPIGVALARHQELLLRADWELRDDETALLQHFGAKMIGLLPLVIRGMLVGCLYYDRITSPLAPTPEIDAGLRRLRDRAVVALGRRR